MARKQSVIIHDIGKIDIHQRMERLQVALDRLDKDQTIHPDNKQLLNNFIHDCMLGKTVIGKRKKKIGPATCLKHMSALRILCRELGKSLHEVTQTDMEKFIFNLENNVLRNYRGEAYSDETKAGIKKTIRKFWKWKDGENKTYPAIVEWIDTYCTVKDVPALTRSEVDKMIEHTSNPRDRALVMVLFDSGARIEELLNVRLKKEHLFWKEELGCYLMRLEYSKTKPRTISLVLCTDYILKWLEAHPAKNNSQVQLFPMTYGNVRMLIRRLGQRALGKRVTAHILRHSSATFYANRLKSPYKLCRRYGWTMASDMVNRYLDREGILEEETATLVKSDEISRANKENSTLREELALLKESHSELSGQFQELQQKLEALESGKGVLSLLMSLVQKDRGIKAVEELAGKGFDIVLSSDGIRAKQSQATS